MGLHAESTRRAGGAAVVAAGVVAVAAAVSVARASFGADGLALALAAMVLALLVRSPNATRQQPLPRAWGLRAAGWLVVGAGFVCAVGAAHPAGAAAVAGLAVLVLGAAAAARIGVAVGAVAAASFLMHARTPEATGAARMLAREDGVAVFYDRGSQEQQVRVVGEAVAAAGPDRDEEPLLEALLHVFVRSGDVVTTLGRGTGRIGAALTKQQRCVVDVVDAWPAIAGLEARARADGPVAPPNASVPAQPSPRSIASLADGSRQVLCVCEVPVAATAHRATPAFQRELRRVVGDGLVLQPIAIDRVATRLLRDLLDAAREAHPWNGVFRVGAAVVLASSAAPPAPAGGALARDDARWAFHRAHLGGLGDLAQAFLGELVPVAPRPGRGSTASWLLARSVRAPTAPASSDGLLRWWRRQRRDQQRALDQLRGLPDDDRGRREA
ncbi:MAG: hypothetical protein VYD05_04235, partial [Planctomycetota bacterium]|nr:hypothetical protein [Planctomycetota bacterium]